MTSASITDFLNRALADGAVDVAELEAKARAAGLIGERQQIQHAKAFKKAKKALGIRSIRDGFGSGGRWAWLMPPQVTQMTTGSTANSELGSKRQHSASAPAPPITPAHGSETCSVVQQWADGIERLDYARSPAAVPLIRWRQFLGDCHGFLNSSDSWAERAATLGWSALALFGCHHRRPLEHLASAGLLWAINGGKLVELHRDWAVIERAEERSRHVHHRRSSAAANIALPWNGARDVQSRDH
jgi:hypothetical protein